MEKAIRGIARLEYPRVVTAVVVNDAPTTTARCLCRVYSFFFSSRRRHTRFDCDWSSDVCSSDLASLSHVRGAVNLRNRCAFRGIAIVDRLLKMVSSERIRTSFLFRTLQRASAAAEERLRPAVAPSAIFQDRIRSAGAPVNKIFLFVNHEDHKIEVEPIAPFEMARRLAFLVQHELSPLLQHYSAYRFAFPSRRNEFLEDVAESSCETLARALMGKETYVVRLPYPHMFPELYQAMQPFCKSVPAAVGESVCAVG